MKLGPLFVARNSFAVATKVVTFGILGRSTLGGTPLGWRLEASARPLNRSVSMNIDRPTVGRYNW